MADISGLGQFASKFPKAHFPKDELISEGDHVNGHVYYLESGLVKQYCISQSGSLFITHLFRPGAVFPPTAISGTELNSSYFEAFIPVTVRVIPFTPFIDFLKTHPDTLLEYGARLSRYFGLLSQRINQLASYSAYQRTAAIIVYLGDRIGTHDYGHKRIILNTVLTHKELGSWIGTTRETTSIQMKRLQKKDLISYHDRKIVIKNWDDLVKESGQ